MKKYKIAITTGDKKGIGKELVVKALKNLNLKNDDVLIIGEKLDLNYDFFEIDEKDNGKFCYKSLEKACSFAKQGLIEGIVTAPVSKEELYKSGYFYNGQTEVLEKLLSINNQKAQMLFIADSLRVMLLTRHLPLKEIELSVEDVVFKTEILNNFLIQKCKIEKPLIALCAFNPHAGENGILGREEIEILNPAVKILISKGINVLNPMSADSLFAKVGKDYLEGKKVRYDAILACYHDQGLCPVKALAMDKAVNTTIGLDVIRTSPSSGTAYDIVGKNIADPQSMVEAIKLAINLCNN